MADEHTFADPSYWSCHARSPVRFAQSMQVLAERGCEIFLEIGPSPTLIGLGRRCLEQDDYAWLPSLRPDRSRDDWQSMLESLGQLYVRGAKVDWAGFDRPYPRRKVSLPTYPFQRKRYWAGSVPDASSAGLAGPARNGREVHPLLGRRLIAAVREQVFETQMSAHRPATLADHKIQGKVIMPGAAYLEMALAAGAALHGKPWCVRDMSLVEPLLLDKTPKTVQTIVTPEGPQAASIRIVSLAAGDGESEPAFAAHAAAIWRPTIGTWCPRRPRWRSSTWRPSARGFQGEARDAAWRNEALRKSGLEPGPTFSWVDLHWTNPQEALASCGPPARPTGPASTMFIPVCWTACSSCWGRSCPARARASTPTCRWPSRACNALRFRKGRFGRWPR